MPAWHELVTTTISTKNIVKINKIYMKTIRFQKTLTKLLGMPTFKRKMSFKHLTPSYRLNIWQITRNEK